MRRLNPARAAIIQPSAIRSARAGPNRMTASLHLARFWLALALSLTSALASAAAHRLPLWEATGPSGTLYLYGSIHVCNARCQPLPEAVLKRLLASNSLVVELDPHRPELQEKFLAAAMLPAGQHLDDMLPRADWQALARVGTTLGMQPDALRGMQPWMAGLMLTLVAAKQAGFDAAEGIDVSLMQKASEFGLELEELETVDEQIAALASGNAQEQNEALQLTLQMLSKGRMAGYLASLLHAWQNGDTAALDRLVREGTPKNSALARAMFDDRNIKMAERLQRLMQDGRPRFVVIGAGHLVGKQGVPALLAKQGYRVRQLRTDE